MLIAEEWRGYSLGLACEREETKVVKLKKGTGADGAWAYLFVNISPHKSNQLLLKLNQFGRDNHHGFSSYSCNPSPPDAPRRSRERYSFILSPVLYSRSQTRLFYGHVATPSTELTGLFGYPRPTP